MQNQPFSRQPQNGAMRPRGYSPDGFRRSAMPEPMQEFDMMPLDNLPYMTQDDGSRAMSDPMYMPAILSEYIGKVVRLEFAVNGGIVQKTGRLLVVGANYIMTQSADPRVVQFSDLGSLRFVSVILEDGEAMMN